MEPAARSLAGLAGRAGRGLRLAQRPPCLVEKGDAGGRQRDGLTVAAQEIDAKFDLELAHLLAHRRLGDVQQLGGAVEVQLLGDRDEVPQAA